MVTELFGVLGGGSMILGIGVVIGRQTNVRKDILKLAKKLHDLEDWRNATLPKEYVQREALSLTLRPLTDALMRLEAQQESIAVDLKAVTRWIDQHRESG